MRRPTRGSPALLAGSVLALVATGCGLVSQMGPSLDGAPGEVVRVLVDATSLGLVADPAPTLLPVTTDDVQLVARALAPPSQPAEVLLRVSGAGIATPVERIVAGLPPDIQVVVPPGAARLFELAYRGSGSEVLAEGSVTADVGGGVEVVISLESGVKGVRLGQVNAGALLSGSSPGSFPSTSFSVFNDSGGTMVLQDATIRFFNPSGVEQNSPFSVGVPSLSGPIANGSSGLASFPITIVAGGVSGQTFRVEPVLKAIDGKSRLFIKRVGVQPRTVLSL